LEASISATKMTPRVPISFPDRSNVRILWSLYKYERGNKKHAS